MKNNSKINSVKGMHDILPSTCEQWSHIETIFRNVLKQYGYEEIRLPLIEATAVFKRSIGLATDIVEKEMYTFTDLNGESLSLRPEGTAGCVRATIENGMLYNKQQKLWYQGPMFRRERPQRGRYRQFHQLGVEVFNYKDIGIELELLQLTVNLWNIFEITPMVELQINTLGSMSERFLYQEKLKKYFNQYFSLLDEDSKRRLLNNPLRILDSKNPAMQEIIANAPLLIDSLDTTTCQRFNLLCTNLERLNIAYRINYHLVRGLDYYNDLVFEWVTKDKDSQNKHLCRRKIRRSSKSTRRGSNNGCRFCSGNRACFAVS